MKRLLAALGWALLASPAVAQYGYGQNQNAFGGYGQQNTAQQPSGGGAPSALRDLTIQAYQPSYVGVGRAVAVLKGMGYPVIEYQVLTGQNGERSYQPNVPSDLTPPVIIMLPDATKTSLMDPPGNPNALNAQIAQTGGGFGGGNAVPDIGGTYLHGVTSGEAQQRMLIAYDPADRDSLNKLLDTLNDHIDVPAEQIVIEALVIEVNKDRLRDIGITLQASFDDKYTADFSRDGSDRQLPAIFTFDDSIVSAPGGFQAQLRALVNRGDAEVLSNPSVLVLDGRQARIQVGQQIPVTTSTATDSFVQANVDYFPVGIVLNLRPRVGADGQEVSMQVETIVSAVNAQATAVVAGDNVERAPVVDNRQVQTFVRVANNTPFIIGGLIATEETTQVSGVPGLSSIPGLGRLFQRRTKEKFKSEVIIVLTPHVVPKDDTQFSYTRPKDSEIFDSEDNKLFLDRYRVRDEEVFDLSYLKASDTLEAAQAAAWQWVRANPDAEPSADMLALARGDVPGEQVLVRRMLWETIRSQRREDDVRPSKIVLFTRKQPHEPPKFGFLRQLTKHMARDQALVLSFPAEEDGQFEQPAALVQYVDLEGTSHGELIEQYNQDGMHSVVISRNAPGLRSPVRWLQSAAVLKRLIELNSNVPLTLDSFYTGLQLIYPTEDDLSKGFHLLDAETAKYWYQIQNYYPAFEQHLNAALREIAAQDPSLNIRNRQSAKPGNAKRSRAGNANCGVAGRGGPRSRRRGGASGDCPANAAAPTTMPAQERREESPETVGPSASEARGTPLPDRPPANDAPPAPVVEPEPAPEPGPEPQPEPDPVNDSPPAPVDDYEAFQQAFDEAMEASGEPSGGDDASDSSNDWPDDELP